MSMNRPKFLSLAPGADPFRERTCRQWGELHETLPALRNECGRGQVHATRVLSRRLRAAFGIIVKMGKNPVLKKIGRDLRSLTRLLGPIRSMDVTVKLWEERLRGLPAARQLLLGAVAGRLRAKRKRLRKKVRDDGPIPSLQRVTVAKLDRLLKALPPENFSDPFHLKFGKATRKAEAARRKFSENPTLKRLHELRIGLKKWRYLAEIRSSCFNPLPKSFFLKLKSVQDELGALHDLDVLRKELGGVDRRKKGGKKTKAALRAVLADFHREIEDGVRRFYARAGELESMLTLRAL